METIQTTLDYHEFKIFCAKKFQIPLEKLSDELIEQIIYFANYNEPNSITIEDLSENWESLYHENNWLLEIGSKKIKINLKIVTLETICIIIDYFYTDGLLSYLIESSNLNDSNIFILNSKNGEVCNLNIIKTNKISNFKELEKRISNNKCLYPSLNCSFMNQSICGITINDIKKNIYLLKEKNIIFEKDNTWQI